MRAGAFSCVLAAPAFFPALPLFSALFSAPAEAGLPPGVSSTYEHYSTKGSGAAVAADASTLVFDYGEAVDGDGAAASPTAFFPSASADAVALPPSFPAAAQPASTVMAQSAEPALAPGVRRRANFVFLCPPASFAHYQIGVALELARRGHNVLLLSLPPLARHLAPQLAGRPRAAPLPDLWEVSGAFADAHSRGASLEAEVASIDGRLRKLGQWAQRVHPGAERKKAAAVWQFYTAGFAGITNVVDAALAAFEKCAQRGPPPTAAGDAPDARLAAEEGAAAVGLTASPGRGSDNGPGDAPGGAAAGGKASGAAAGGAAAGGGAGADDSLASAAGSAACDILSDPFFSPPVLKRLEFLRRFRRSLLLVLPFNLNQPVAWAQRHGFAYTVAYPSAGMMQTLPMTLAGGWGGNSAVSRALEAFRVLRSWAAGPDPYMRLAYAAPALTLVYAPPFLAPVADAPPTTVFVGPVVSEGRKSAEHLTAEMKALFEEVARGAGEAAAGVGAAESGAADSGASAAGFSAAPGGAAASGGVSGAADAAADAAGVASSGAVSGAASSAAGAASGAVPAIIYISLGSYAQLSAELVQKVASGIIEPCVTRITACGVIWALPEAQQRLVPASTLALAGRRLVLAAWVQTPAVLAQPAVRLFVSHCGMNGLGEGTAAGVPILGLPLFGDQPSNCRTAERFGHVRCADLVRADPADLADLALHALENATMRRHAQRAKAILASAYPGATKAAAPGLQRGRRKESITAIPLSDWLELAHELRGDFSRMQAPMQELGPLRAHKGDGLLLLAAAAAAAVCAPVAAGRAFRRWRRRRQAQAKKVD